jgi:uncharacterized protein (DUF2164 family)
MERIDKLNAIIETIIHNYSKKMLFTNQGITDIVVEYVARVFHKCEDLNDIEKRFIIKQVNGLYDILDEKIKINNE